MMQSSESLNFAIVGSLIGRLGFFGLDAFETVGLCGSDLSEKIRFCGSESENIGLIRFIKSRSQQNYLLTFNNCRYHINKFHRASFDYDFMRIAGSRIDYHLCSIVTLFSQFVQFNFQGYDLEKIQVRCSLSPSHGIAI